MSGIIVCGSENLNWVTSAESWMANSEGRLQQVFNLDEISVVEGGDSTDVRRVLLHRGPVAELLEQETTGCLIVAFYSAPEVAFVGSQLEMADSATFIRNWRDQSKALLDLYLENPQQRCLFNVAGSFSIKEYLEIADKRHSSGAIDSDEERKTTEHQNAGSLEASLRALLFLIKHRNDVLTQEAYERLGAASRLGGPIQKLAIEARLAELSGLVSNQFDGFLASRGNEAKFVSELKAENDSLSAQVAKLERELETTSLSCRKTAEELEKVEAEKQALVKSSKEEQKLLLLQQNQLQQELEKIHLSKSKGEMKLSEVASKLKDAEARAQNEKGQTERLTSELELCSIQINQLQEELEEYYLQLQEARNWKGIKKQGAGSKHRLEKTVELVSFLQ